MDIGPTRLLYGTIRGRKGYRPPSFLADPEIHRALRRDGYCVTDRTVSPAVVASVRQMVEAHAATAVLDARGSVYSLGWGADPELPLDRFTELRTILIPEIEGLVDPQRARVHLSSFQMKPSAPNSYLEGHQDSTMVDESTEFGLNAWTALEPSTRENGALFVLPGSHRFGNRWRIGTETDDLAHLRTAIEAHAVVITSAPGQVVLLDQAVLHGSLPNTSGRRRAAISCHILPRASDITIPFTTRDTPEGSVELRRYEPAQLDAAAAALERGDQPDLSGRVEGPVRLDRLTFGPRALAIACRIHERVTRAPNRGQPTLASVLQHSG